LSCFLKPLYSSIKPEKIKEKTKPNQENDNENRVKGVLTKEFVQD